MFEHFWLDFFETRFFFRFQSLLEAGYLIEPFFYSSNIRFRRPDVDLLSCQLCDTTRGGPEVQAQPSPSPRSPPERLCLHRVHQIRRRRRQPAVPVIRHRNASPS